MGANCHILQVAAGNLQLAEKQFGCGHKQRLWRTGCVAVAQLEPRSKHTVIISRIVQIIILHVCGVGGGRQQAGNSGLPVFGSTLVYLRIL